MTGNEIKDFFENLIDDELESDDFAYSLMNFVKDRIECMRDWEFLRASNSSSSFTTSAISLPADFFKMTWVFVGSNNNPYLEVPYNQKRAFVNHSNRFYIDYANNNLYFLGSGSGTVYMEYIKFTDDLTSDTSPVFNKKFHKLIAIGMASLFGAIDQEQPSQSWSGKWEQVDKSFLQSMLSWDDDLKNRAEENGYSPVDFMAGVKDPEWYPNE